MVIEIKGTGPHNKGAEMMLLTIIQELDKKSLNTKFTIAPNQYGCDYSFFSKLNLFPKVWFRYRGFQLGKLGRFIPKVLRNLYGMILDEEVDIVLDASGFAYTSQWGIERTKIMSEESTKWKKANKKIILLPQAFGPFDDSTIKKYMIQIIDNSDVIYARDPFSYNELLQLKKDTNKIRLFPDFTILFKGVKPKYFDPDKYNVCIVPNIRMKDMRSDSSDYEEYFSRIIKKIQNKRLKPFFLIHGGVEDTPLVDKINTFLDDKIDIISEENPSYIKGIIANSKGLVSSRFHALASALYSGVPSIGTGWSHKYQYLFEEFDYKEGLIDLDLTDMELDVKLEVITNAEKRQKIKNKLQLHKETIEKKTIEMFDQIEDELRKVN